ncbi:MAG: hypothetical protein ACK4OK_06635, partial [Thermoflexus sp.]
AYPTARESLRGIYAGIWVAMFLSTPLVWITRTALGIAVMPTLPVLAWGGWRMVKMDVPSSAQQASPNHRL